MKKNVRNKLNNLLKWGGTCLLVIGFIVLTPIVFNRMGIINLSDDSIRDSTRTGFYGSYIGSIIGGALTFGGVVLTLYFTRKQMAEEKRLTLLPYLKPTIIELPSDYQYKPNNSEPVIFATSMGDSYYEKIKLNLEIENIGLGSAVDVTLEYVGEIRNDVYNIYSIKKDEIVKFYCELDQDLIDYNELMTMVFTFKDLLDNSYVQVMSMEVYHYNDSTHYVSLFSYDAPKLNLD